MLCVCVSSRGGTNRCAERWPGRVASGLRAGAKVGKCHSQPQRQATCNSRPTAALCHSAIVNAAFTLAAKFTTTTATPDKREQAQAGASFTLFACSSTSLASPSPGRGEEGGVAPGPGQRELVHNSTVNRFRERCGVWSCGQALSDTGHWQLEGADEIIGA